MKKIILGFVFCFLFEICAGKPIQKGGFIFAPDSLKHGHTHGSCIVECPDADLLACWYEGKTDRSEDVHIQAARWIKATGKWSEPFLLADTPMLSDNNPSMIIDPKKRLWLFYYTLLGSPEEAWETAFIRYKISRPLGEDTHAIIWERESDLPVNVKYLDEVIEKILQTSQVGLDDSGQNQSEQIRTKLKSQMARRLGWTIRAHPFLLASGVLLLPMASEVFGLAGMAITRDEGRTWQFSRPPQGYGVEQPCIFERKDGTLVAYFRDSSELHKIRKSESSDQGFNWSPVTSTDLPNPGSGIDVLRLKNGLIALIYNDVNKDPRSSLVVSLSDDEGRTWKWTRHIEQSLTGRYDYPSIIQSKDGLIHVTYSVNVQSIKHVTFDEAWIKAGD